MSNTAHLLYLLLMTEKKKVIAWTKYSSNSERSCLALLENVMDYWVLSYHYQDVNP